MKRLLLILMFLLPALAFGQKHAYFGTPTTIDSFNLTMWVRQFKMPRVPLVNPYFDSVGSVYLNTSTGTVYFHDGSGWQPIAGGGGGGGGLQHAGPWLTVANDTVYFDTVRRLDYVLANTDLKVPTAKAVRTALGDSVSGRVKYSDTLTVIGARSWVTTNYLPYTGAISNTNTGEYSIKAGQYDLDLTPTGTYTTGTTYWDATHLAPATYLNSSVTNVNGQTFYMRGRNNTGTTIAKGKAVYVNDAQGNNPTISLADADSVTTSQVIGITAESIADNATGYVMVSGYLDGVNTSAYADGDALYLDTTNGNLTNQLLPSPHNVVFVAYALNSTVNGRYFIRPSSPIASDTTMTAGSNQIAPTQAAVKKFVQSRGYGTGTVTSVGSGFGLSGGTITTTGTLRVDTANVPTQYRVDTTAFNALTRINTKGSGTVTSIQVVGGTGATVTPTTAVTTSGVYTVTPEVSSATFNTLTNKRITYRTGGAASYTTSVTIPADSVDVFVITAQSGALLFNAPSGTPTQCQMLLVRVKPASGTNALTWNAIWRSGDVTLPTTTTSGKTLYMEFLYNSTDSKWDIVGKSDNY